MTVTFDSRPPKGWLGYCTVENCEGQTPTGISLGYAYSADYYYFVFYGTSDAMQAAPNDDQPIEEVGVWASQFFTWTVTQAPTIPDNTAVASILEAIGAG